jgi:hypothetical protein
MSEKSRLTPGGTNALLDNDRRTPRPSSFSMDYGELQDRFDTFVMLVESRIGELGMNPDSVLVVSREQLKLTATATAAGPSAPYTMYLSAAIQSGPLGKVAEEFVTGWLKRDRDKEQRRPS